LEEQGMGKKDLDIIDLLEPVQINVKNYENKTNPFQGTEWIDSSDLTIQEIAKLLPYQLSFIYSLLHEYPELLPSERHMPGRIQELVFQDIMKNLVSKTKRNYSLERKVTQLWIENGGIKPKQKIRGKKNA
jgi:hypothetical protein